MGKRYLVFALLFTLIGLAVPSIAQAGLAQYERTSTNIWHTQLPDIQYAWTYGEQHTEYECGINDPGGRVIACAIIGGRHMWIDWEYWHSTTRVERCEIHSHEVGHLLGWDHGDYVFQRMERRAARVCVGQYSRLKGVGAWL